MNAADWIIVVVILMSTVQAAASGFFQEAFGIAGLFFGYVIAAWQYHRLGLWLGNYLKLPKPPGQVCHDRRSHGANVPSHAPRTVDINDRE